jgi:plastocyanin
LLVVLFVASCGGSDGDSSAKIADTERTTTSSSSSSTSSSVDVTTSSMPPVVLSTSTTVKTTTTTARPTGTTTTSAAPRPTTTAPAPKTWSISIKNFAFAPPVLQIHVGDTVTVKNDDAPTHTWTADDGSFDSGNLAPGATFSHVFGKAGTVTYHCEIHASMKGTIQVS